MNHRRSHATVAILLCLFLLNSTKTDIWGQTDVEAEEKPKSYTVSPATSDIKIDGVLDEQAWQEATVGDFPYEWMPGDNVPPPVETEFLITFSSSHLYIGYRCYDPEPQKIRAHLMDRDAMDKFIQDDHVNFIVDPFNDERRGFQFRVNPLGVQADANFSELEGYEDFSWDAIWDAAGKITDWGYAIEIAIPFNQLRFPAGEALQTWGFSFGRSYPRSVRHRIITHKRPRDLTCILCQTNKITGFQGMKTGWNLEVAPTLTADRTDERADIPGGPLEKGKERVEPGLSVRWGMTSNLVMNGTVNPDFSQVEADVAQLQVNERFAIRFPEKRPFFLEGADFFLTPIEAVFTRTVADPAGGLKFTGKIGKNAVGFFGAVDEINNLLFPSNQGSSSASLDQRVPSGVLRYRRDVGKRSAFGLLYTGRTSDDYFNHTAGFDGFFRLSRTKTLTFQYLHSETRYADDLAEEQGQTRGQFGGNAFEAEFGHFGRDWIYNAQYRDYSPGFRADYGYVPRVDIRRASGQLARLVWGKPGDWYNRLLFSTSGFAVYDHDNKLTDSHAELTSQYLGPLQSTLILSFGWNQEYYAGRDYDYNQVVTVFEIKPIGGLRIHYTGIFGGTVDYTNSQPAKQILARPEFEFSLGRHIDINLQHTLQSLKNGGEKIFTANLIQGRFIYNFNVRAFVRLIVQYLDVSRNLDQYSVPLPEKTRTLFTQFLFSYKLNPQTVLFIGYSDNYLGMTRIDLTQTDRTFFIKLGYAWTR